MLPEDVQATSSISKSINQSATVSQHSKDFFTASVRVRDNSAKLVKLDTRRQKIREALRLLKNPQQESTTWMALTTDLMMKFPQSEIAEILQDSLQKADDDYIFVRKQRAHQLSEALKADSGKDLKSRSFDLKPINK